MAEVLFVYENVVLGDTVIVNIPKRCEKYLHQEGTLTFGTLQIPIE
jgi:hypothetical protein